VFWTILAPLSQDFDCRLGPLAEYELECEFECDEPRVPFPPLLLLLLLLLLVEKEEDVDVDADDESNPCWVVT